MNILVALALILFSAPAAANVIHVGGVSTFDVKGSEYQVYTPANYQPSKRWPLIALVGRAADLDLFQPAAAKYGYIVARFDREGAKEGWKDVRKRVSLDNSRAYVVLVGHDAERAALSDLDGAAGLALVNALSSTIDAPTLFFAFGNRDSRYIELKQLSQLTREQRRRIGVDMFDGAEPTGETAARIVEWFHLDALEQGTAEVSADHMQAIVDSWSAAAESLEASDPLRAVSMYNVVVANFSAVTSKARMRANALVSSLAYGRAEYAEKRALNWEAAEKRKLAASIYARDRDPEAYFTRYNFKSIREKLSDRTSAWSNAAARLLRYAAEVADEQAGSSSGERKQFWEGVAQQLR